MDEHINSLKILLSEYGNLTVSLISLKLNLSIDQSRELALSFVEINGDYRILYNVEYTEEDNNLRMCVATSEDLHDLTSKYTSVKSSVYAIMNKNYDFDLVFKNIFENTIKLSQEQMIRSFENNTLYIPEFLTLKVSNIKLRNFETSPPTEPYVKEQKPKEPVKVLKTEFSESDDEEFKEPSKIIESLLFGETSSADEFKSSPNLDDKKRKPSIEIKDKPKSHTEHKKLKLKKEIKDDSSMDIDDQLFDDEPQMINVLDKRIQEPQSIKFVEKVSKENTYVENGYYVVEESDDYVEVVKDNNTNAHYKNAQTHTSKPLLTQDKNDLNLNGKKTGVSKPADSKKKLSQSSIMSFFKK